MQTFSLYELNVFIKQVFLLNFQEPFWVKCEIAQVKQSRGHYYIDIVQKDEDGEEIIAQSRAVLWATSYQKLHRKLGFELQGILQEGFEVLILATINFHERYGLSLTVEDFDTSYTLGKLELKRREIIRQLQSLNLIDKNKAIELPKVIQNLAVISSESAAGYQDFLEHLRDNPYTYKFHCQLFPSSMQGNNVEPEMLGKLEDINHNHRIFDALVIIRGGGAKLDLVAFDSLALCTAIANFPIPVFTGIGHDVDETVMDMVAHTSLKTPTAVADFIIQTNFNFESGILTHGLFIKNKALQSIKKAELIQQQLWQNISFRSLANINRQSLMLDYAGKEIPALVKNRIEKDRLKLDALEKAIIMLSPEASLKRGFSITTHNGKVVTNTSGIKPGDELETILLKGTLASIVKKVNHD